MSSILLCLCPSFGVEMPPLSLALLKAAINKGEQRADCLDFNYRAWRQIKKKLYWEKNSLHCWTNPELFATHLQKPLEPLINEWATEINSHNADTVGFSFYESNYRCTNLLIETLRKNGCPKKIIAGGPLTFCRETRIKISALVDYIQIGEGEEALKEWLLYVKKGGGSLPESVYKRAFIRDNYQNFPLRKISSPENFPPPDFSDFAIASYETKAMPMIASRGCLFNCAFCADSPLSRPFRKLSTKNLQERLHRIYKNGCRLLWFNDLLINGVISEITTAFRQLEEIGLRMEWTALATPDPKMSKAILNELAEIGCISLNLGLESGSDKVLQLMQKSFNRNVAKESIKNIFQAGIKVQLNLMVGFPGETSEDFQQTISLLDELRHCINGFTSVNTCIVLPGSRLFARKEEYGIEFPPSQDPTQWTIGTKNTPAIRQERMQILRDWIKKAGLETWNTNYERAASC